MKTWIYVAAVEDAMFGVSFIQTIVKARNEDEAYCKGGRWADTQVAHSTLLNDFVTAI